MPSSARLAALLLLGLLSACRPSSELVGTALLVVTDSSGLEVDQLGYEGFVDGGVLFAPVLRPSQAAGVLASSTSVRVLLRDGLDGQPCEVAVTGLLGGAPVASGLARAVIVRGLETRVDVRLAAPDPCAGCTGCCSASKVCMTPSLATCGAGGSACTACDARLADGCGSGLCSCGDGPACSAALGADRCAQGQCACGAGPVCEAGQECLQQSCQCTPNSCAGCCQGNHCVLTQSATACGTGGTACLDCGGASCVSGVCSATPPCSPASCPSGCCVGTTCVLGASADACGTRGLACQNCGTGLCTGGACTGGCDPSSCPTGCCVGGVCQAGTSTTACGTQGLACQSCTGACTNHACEAPCGASSCAGCCRQGLCLAGTADDSCGAGGASCQACSQATCDDAGVCQPTCDATSCPSGCCSNGTCLPGTATNACGTGGSACQSCLGGCSNQACAATCGPSTCAAGCCSSGACVAGDSNQACGTGGRSCGSCGAGTSCDAGSCTSLAGCDAKSCPTGCCDASGCRASSSASCGLSGAACQACTLPTSDGCRSNGLCGCGGNAACVAGQRCSGGKCVCDPATCAGCCSGTTCAAGTKKSECGSDGGTCVNCQGLSCQSGACR